MPMFANGLPVPFLTRSWLLIPPPEEAAMNAGFASGADILVFDLSPLPASALRGTAERLRAYLLERKRAEAEPAVFIGIPAVSAETEDLLADLLPARPQGILLMEVANAHELQQVDVHLATEEAILGIAEGEVRLAALMAHGLGVSVAGLSRRLIALGWSADLLQRLTGARRMHDSEGLLTETFAQARASVLLAAAQARVEVLDTASGLFSTERLARDCREAAADGFTGKITLSPRQVTAINHGFLPSLDEIDEARAILGSPEAASEAQRLRALRVVRRATLEKR